MMPFRCNLQKGVKNKIKFNKKNEGFFFGQHPLAEKSPTATGVYVYLHQAEDNLFVSLYDSTNLLLSAKQNICN